MDETHRKTDLADYLLLTGGAGKHPQTEARVMRDLAINEGVSPETIILDERATSTFENAIHCARLMRDKNLTTAIVVSDSYHLPRSVMTFRSFGIEATGSSTSDAKNDYPYWKWVYFHLREFVALLWYIVLIVSTKLRCGNLIR